MSDEKFAGYDFGGSMVGNGRFIGHGGGALGMNGMLYHFFDSDFTMTVLANRDPMAADAVATFAAHRLPGKSHLVSLRSVRPFRFGQIFDVVDAAVVAIDRRSERGADGGICTAYRIAATANITAIRVQFGVFQELPVIHD